MRGNAVTKPYIPGERKQPMQDRSVGVDIGMPPRWKIVELANILAQQWYMGRRKTFRLDELRLPPPNPRHLRVLQPGEKARTNRNDYRNYQHKRGPHK